MRGSIVYYYANYYANHDIKITHQWQKKYTKIYSLSYILHKLNL